MASVVVNGDTSGAVTLSAPAVAGTVTVTLPSTSGTMAVLPTATGVLAESAGGTGTTTGYYGFKNRLINSAMVIDQRNAGASVTQTTSSPYTVDRFFCFGSVTSKFTVQQNAASVTPPAGFINYLGATSSSAYTVGAAEQFNIGQAIEGLNIADFAWGTASAATVALSFWVRSSLTGTFGGALRNSATDYSYPFSYTISVANTWEQKTITITGPTSGTWLTTNGIGVYLTFSMGAGATRSGTAGSWSANNYTSATGATSVVGTNGATFYITGVQLEKGSTATSFDYRPYGTELLLCQRYYETTSYPNSGQDITSTQVSILWASSFSTGQKYLVAKRAAPTVTLYGRTGVAGSPTRTDTGAAITGTSTASNIGATGYWSAGLGQVLTAYSTFALEIGYTASAEL